MKLLKTLKPHLLKRCVRNFGMIENYQQKKQNQEFEKNLNYFLSKDTYNLADYKQYLNDSIKEQKKGVIRKFFNNDESNQSEMIEQRTMLNALFEDEMVNYSKFQNSHKLKEEVALTVGTTLDRIEFLFDNFKQMLYLHAWLNDIKKNEGVLPNNQEEMMYRFKMERKIPYAEKLILRKNNRKARTLYTKETSVIKHKQKIEERKMKKRQVWKIIKHHNY